MEIQAKGMPARIGSLSSSDCGSRTKSRLRFLEALSFAGNSQPSHPVLQRGTLDAESRGRAVGPGHSPMRLLENTQNLLAFAFINRSSGVPKVGNLQFAVLFTTVERIAGLEIRSRYVQYGPRGDDHGAFNHVLQFANIARPVIFAQRRHGCRWN